MKVYSKAQQKRTPRCSSCSKPTLAHFCADCLRQFPMLRKLIPTPGSRA